MCRTCPGNIMILRFLIKVIQWWLRTRDAADWNLWQIILQINVRVFWLFPLFKNKTVWNQWYQTETENQRFVQNRLDLPKKKWLVIVWDQTSGQRSHCAQTQTICLKLKYEDKLYEFCPNVCFYYKVSFCVSIPRLQQQNTEETNRENIPVWLDETPFEAVMWRGPPHKQWVVASLFVTQLLVLSPPLCVLAWSRLKVKGQSSQTSAGFGRSSFQLTERLRRRTWTLMS